MSNYSLNQKVVLKTYGNEYEAEGIIVAIMGFSNMELEQNNALRFKVRIDNMVTDWIPESIIKEFPNGQHQIFNS
jgi:hypothetical protein